jgi:hypothetical protein
MKIPQLSGAKTNSNQQPRHCCHISLEGTPCKAHPRTGKQYCFFHDPASQEKRAAARRAGGVIRSHNAQPAQKLPANLPRKPLRKFSDIAELLEETVNHVRQGEMDLQSARTIGYLAYALVHTLNSSVRAEQAERKAASVNAPRDSSGKKLPPQKLPPKIRLEFTDIATGRHGVIIPNPDGKTSTTTILDPGRPPRPPQNDVGVPAAVNSTLPNHLGAASVGSTPVPQPKPPNTNGDSKPEPISPPARQDRQTQNGVSPGRSPRPASCPTY